MTTRRIPYVDIGQEVGRVVNGRVVLDQWFADAWNDLVNRTGGQLNDQVAASLVLSSMAQATSAALSAGVNPGGYTLDPADPITINYAETTATITVAAHTRTEGGVPTAIAGGTTAAVDRGAVYYVYYTTPGTYLTTLTPAALTVGGAKLVATVTVLPQASVNTGVGGFLAGNVQLP